jgi:ribosomal protein S18 acetylase RimI-like enzyme
MITTRKFDLNDYDAALELWKRGEEIEIAEGDAREEVALFLERNHGLSRAAVQGGQLVGVALCGHDARRGYIYHLAVDPSVRRLGLAARLVEECLDGLRGAGVTRALILVSDDNSGGRSFWQRRGWERLDGVGVMGIDL